jgi:dihydrofolate reductase
MTTAEMPDTERIVMGSVLLDVSMSLDGFIAGPNVGVGLPLGEGGERLHDWMSSADPDRAGDWHRTGASDLDAEVKQELLVTTGAVVMGRRTFDVGVGPWGDTPFPVPCFVLTHEARDPLVKESGTFTFVTDGIQGALRRAQAAAGGKHVSLMGADLAQQVLSAGLLDELHIHLAPVLIGAGTRLFDNLGSNHIELERTRLIESPLATHLTFRVVRRAVAAAAGRAGR